MALVQRLSRQVERLDAKVSVRSVRRGGMPVGWGGGGGGLTRKGGEQAKATEEELGQLREQLQERDDEVDRMLQREEEVKGALQQLRTAKVSLRLSR